MESHDPFEIVQIPADLDPESEPMGSKSKSWLRLEGRGRCLFKEARAGTGEDWAEKIAAELAELLRLPHAPIDLARRGEKRGLLSYSVVQDGEELIHGNELLYERLPDYPPPAGDSRKFSRVPQHRLTTVLAANADPKLELPLRWIAPPAITVAAEVFVGYLLLDAWIGNTDRHHQNWAWLRRLGPPGTAADSRYYLCATFDHGSSLGWDLTDEVRRKRLVTRDRQYTVEAYTARARSAFYGDSGEHRPLHPCEALGLAAVSYPTAARVWGGYLVGISEASIMACISRVPPDILSSGSKEFVMRLIKANRRQIVTRLEDIL